VNSGVRGVKIVLKKGMVWLRTVGVRGVSSMHPVKEV